MLFPTFYMLNRWVSIRIFSIIVSVDGIFAIWFLWLVYDYSLVNNCEMTVLFITSSFIDIKGHMLMLIY